MWAGVAVVASTYGASFTRPAPDTDFQCFHRWVVVCRTMCASSAITTSNRSFETFANRSQVVTHQRMPPSPNPAIERVQCGMVIAAGRSATTRTVDTSRCSAIALTARIAVPVLPTPGSSPSRNTRPPAAACAATTSAPSHCWSRGVIGRASGTDRGFSLSSSSRKRSKVYGGGS